MRVVGNDLYALSKRKINVLLKATNVCAAIIGHGEYPHQDRSRQKEICRKKVKLAAS
jgi:hypothetical protein